MKLAVQLLLLCHACLFVMVTTQNVCSRPPTEDFSELVGGPYFYGAGKEVTLSCIQGYTVTGGSRRIFCRDIGQWSKRTLICSPKRCPVPDPPRNGHVDIDEIVYKSVITYRCDPGYILNGNASNECLHTAEWSNPIPDCKPVICGLPSIPPYAKIVYDTQYNDGIFEFGAGGTYECLPPMVLFGQKRAICKEDGSWSETPECKLVGCPEPPVLQHGFRVPERSKEYSYGQRVKYGCRPPYTLDGPVEIECQETSTWSGTPACRAPCGVDIERGRIFYKGRKIWIEDFKPNQVQHQEEVFLYCLNEERDCGYKARMQCVDGVMRIPPCFKTPGRIKYQVSSGSLPSEIAQCT